jgi:hypothetical protein
MYDEAFWNRRYANDDYLYGTEPGYGKGSRNH